MLHLTDPGVRGFRLGAGDFIGVRVNLWEWVKASFEGRCPPLRGGEWAALATVLTDFVLFFVHPPPASARTSMNHVDEIGVEE